MMELFGVKPLKFWEAFKRAAKADHDLKRNLEVLYRSREKNWLARYWHSEKVFQNPKPESELAKMARKNERYEGDDMRTSIIVLRNIIARLSRLAFVKQSMGNIERAAELHEMILRTYENFFKIDFAGVLPRNNLEDKILFEYRIGDIERAATDLERLVTNQYLPKAVRSGQAHFEETQLVTWLDRTLLDMHLKLQAYRAVLERENGNHVSDTTVLVDEAIWLLTGKLLEISWLPEWVKGRLKKIHAQFLTRRKLIELIERQERKLNELMWKVRSRDRIYVEVINSSANKYEFSLIEDRYEEEFYGFSLKRKPEGWDEERRLWKKIHLRFEASEYREGGDIHIPAAHLNLTLTFDETGERYTASLDTDGMAWGDKRAIELDPLKKEVGLESILTVLALRVVAANNVESLDLRNYFKNHHGVLRLDLSKRELKDRHPLLSRTLTLPRGYNRALEIARKLREEIPGLDTDQIERLYQPNYRRDVFTAVIRAFSRHDLISSWAEWRTASDQEKLLVNHVLHALGKMELASSDIVGARSEARKLKIKRIERLTRPTGVLLDVREVTPRSEARLSELLVLLKRHPDFDVYLVGDRDQEIANPKLRKLVADFPQRVHRPGRFDKINRKEILVGLSLTNRKVRFDLPSLLGRRYKTKVTPESLSYKTMGALTASLELMEIATPAELLRGILSYKARRDPRNGLWFVQKSFLAQFATRLRNAYAVAWAA